DDVEIAHLQLIVPAAGGRGVYAVSAASGAGANRVYIHDCFISMVATASTSTYGVQLGTLATGSVNDMLIQNCFFQSGDASTAGANGAAVVMIGTAYGLEIANSTFAALGTGAWARCIENIGTGVPNGVVIRDCDFINSATATSLISTAVYTSGTQVDGAINVLRCYISAGTDMATAAAIVDIVAAETYISSSLIAGQVINGNP
ncbi:MAG: hypothetical protein MN733_12595, partial [Nitrososphaera sp.]|nr:hypothetical protein [Nitrososphaera sp.]